MSIPVQYPEVIPKVVLFTVIDKYRIHLWFDDALERVIDFEPILYGPLWGELRDRELFSQVRLVPGFGTLEWPNGAAIDPALLHDWPEHLDHLIEKRKRWMAASQEG